MTEDEYKLKILALRESLSEKEERIADLRVSVTVLTNKNDQIQAEVDNLRAEVEELRNVQQSQEPTDESD